MNSEKISLILVDDDELIRGGISEWFASEPGFEVLGEAGSADECLALVDRCHPQAALIDIMLPGVTGIELVSKLKRSHPHIKSIVLSGTLIVDRVFDAFEAGAWGFLPKLTSAEEVGRALQCVTKSQWYLSPIMAESVLRKALNLRTQAVASDESPEAQLNERERELLKLIAEGYTFTEIASQLSVSFRSVERMKQKLEEKLNVNKLVDLIRIAIRIGLINP